MLSVGDKKPYGSKSPSKEYLKSVKETEKQNRIRESIDKRNSGSKLQNK